MPLRIRAVILLLVIVTAARSSHALAQGVSSSVTGTVVDQTRDVIRGATVTLVHDTTGTLRVATTNELGGFAFSAVQPGIYTRRIELSGFATIERHNIVVSPNEPVSVGTLQLEIGAVTETVTTTARANIVQTTSSEHSALITSTQIEQIAVRGRDVISLLSILPGVSQGNAIEAPGNSFGTSTPNINGNRATWNTVTVDGVVGNDLGSPNVFSSTINLEAISEVRVELNNYRAEYGGNGGPLVNIITKSGSRAFKGSAYWYKRHEGLNANDFFNNRSGIPKPLYRFDTVGGTVGGPVRVPALNPSGDKLFFFYSFDGWRQLNPQPLRQVTVPTALERAGDFSQSVDLNGRLIVIRDPVTGQPFPGNMIPGMRINPNGQAMLNILPLPNALDRDITRGTYNYNFQESLEVPKRQHVLRVDYHPSARDAFYVRGSTWWADNQGYAVPAGTSNWGLAKLHYLFTDASAIANHTHIFSNSVVNEASVSSRHSNENGPFLGDGELARISRSNAGFTLGQFTPSINPLGIIPQASFGGVTNPANITYNGRTPLTGSDQLVSVNDTVTISRSRHLFKAGLYAERVTNEEGAEAVFGGNFNFGRDVNNPLDTGYAYSNALLGVFQQYTESTGRPGAPGSASVVEWFVQDSWRPTTKLTLDYGLRFAWYSHYQARNGAAAAFALERYDRSKAPLLFRPAIVNGVRVGQNPVTGAAVPAALIGAIVPGTGDLTNGLVVGTDPGYPAGFKDQPPVLPEPRVGFAYDVTGDSRTAVRGSFGIFHNTRASGNANWQAVANPPLKYDPTIFYGTMDTLLQSTGFLFPSTVVGSERETRTPTLYSYSVSVQRDLGWDTVVDVAYVGSNGRNLLQGRDLNLVPYGARFLPENQDPTRPGTPLADNFFRPLPGYESVWLFQNVGTSNYNALQVQVNRRFTHGLQFAVAYTLSRSMDYSSRDDSGRNGSNMRIATYQNPDVWNYGLSDFDRTHVFGVNFTYDVPNVGSRWNNRVAVALLNNWQVSGLTMFATGSPENVAFATVDGADITGGGDTVRSNASTAASGNVPLLVGNPALPGSEQSLAQWFNTAAFARPARGVAGDSPRDVIRMPGLHNSDITVFKNIPLDGGGRRLQLRWEIYNVFNHTQFNAVDRTARFDAAGNQVNARFGQVTSTRAPRIMQIAVRFVF
jgi:hypothetical protein